ncbi:hypothetical protein BOSEA31B_13482 [Hyphomicrobiales bacterium]|nr:hypothetical protein BOSEA31B_13482 [Hyphomicrobiales bacterium]CAH1699253.1 hypothetical protein BOSEA1005_12306 [Hyphomicrobiales bacterium]CAI0343040.1 hypothetical protein BO1005MUT1_210105 [Hyphomicrobiales bacterium]
MHWPSLQIQRTPNFIPESYVFAGRANAWGRLPEIYRLAMQRDTAGHGRAPYPHRACNCPTGDQEEPLHRGCRPRCR